MLNSNKSNNHPRNRGIWENARADRKVHFSRVVRKRSVDASESSFWRAYHEARKRQRFK